MRRIDIYFKLIFKKFEGNGFVRVEINDFIIDLMDSFDEDCIILSDKIIMFIIILIQREVLDIDICVIKENFLYCYVI